MSATTLPAAKTFRKYAPLKPSTGVVEITMPFGALAPNVAEVRINESFYLLLRHETGYRLTGTNDKIEQTVYDLPYDLTACNCPDSIYRPNREGGCKHRKSLCALSRHGKL